MNRASDLGALLARQLDWGEAHVGFERAMAGMPDELQGVMPPGFGHSAWQLLEHMRRAQADILDFCVNPGYVYPTSLAEYWPDARRAFTPIDVEYLCCECRKYYSYVNGTKRFEGRNVFKPSADRA